ncbi:heparinase II/III-family protein [Paenibacillus sp. N4]|uniref:heparinase II/III domain-containing protein n=1 Tax=Paenibacillus vietnamensis TaxID=2590547 RepID=UPI001CD055B9|nr:heparinase II/III family protein [Paenibacillus vietnamensis]MCA0755863.1 heparinase II/III-family protein [Paenibacillus vietnamensis]
MAFASAEREKLQALVSRAEELIGAKDRYFTDGARLALSDMIQAAQKALKGEDRLPFVRNREFCVPREEETIRFAAKRFTMVPPFAEEHSVYTHYGLEPALEWFEKQDMFYGGKETLPLKADSARNKTKELLGEAGPGEAAGCFGEEAFNKLKASLNDLETAMDRFSPEHSGEELAAAIVDCFNRIRECRHSRVLRTDADSAASLYLTREGLDRVKDVIASDPLIRQQYDEIVRISGLYSPEYLEKAVTMIMEGKAGYSELNRHFYLWSSTDKIANFKAPEQAVKAVLSFVLPSEENEEEGLGHVWIDNLEILSANGGSLDIRNAGFDEGDAGPRYWIPEVRKGSPVMKWEDQYPYCGGGDRDRIEPANPSSQVAPRYKDGVSRHSLYLCNPTGEDEGAWTYGEPFEVEGGAGYTLTFEAKLDGKLKTGLKTVITFLDEAGQPAGKYEYVFNRKSSIPGGRFQLAMQCDAIQYAMTGEVELARKVKHALLYILHDFCQGAEHWLVTNLRPEGSDSYGAVQGGRLLSSAAVSYSFIKEAGVFSGEEKERFYGLVDYLLRYMLDLRDRTEWTPYEAQQGCSNWQTDMCAGTGLMMMVLTDFPHRHTWLYNANAVLKAQLELNVNPDCSWPESIRYHHAALERFAGYAKVLHNVFGENWFETTPLARMFGYSIEMQTPGCGYFSGRIGTPPFGDHALGGGGEFGSFATYLADIAAVDRDLADRMYPTWAAAGKPFKKLWGEGIVLENILGQGDNYVPSKPLKLGSTDRFPQAGIYIFRKSFGSPDQSYFAIMSSPEPVAHGHLDQGSFILYKNSVPLVMDSGIEGYFDSSTSWHISSYSHACLQFATRRSVIPADQAGAINLSAGTYSLERGWVDVPRTSRVLDVKLGDSVESITIEILNPEGKGRHIRHVSYVKEPDLYVIRDTVEDFEGPVQFSLPVAARHTVIDGSGVYSEGVYGVDLETVFLSPVRSIRLEKGRSTPFFESGHQGVSMMDYIRTVADAKDGFLTVLYPKEHGKPKLHMIARQNGAVSLQAENVSLRLETAEEHYGVKLFNEEYDK